MGVINKLYHDKGESYEREKGLHENDGRVFKGRCDNAFSNVSCRRLRPPLFKLRTGETVCAVHGKVHLVRSDEEIKEIRERLSILSVLDKLEERTLSIIREQSESNDIDPREIISWLEVLERVRRLKEMSREKHPQPRSQ